MDFIKFAPGGMAVGLEWFLVCDEADYDEVDSAKDSISMMRYFADGHAEKRIYIEGNSPE